MDVTGSDVFGTTTCNIPRNYILCIVKKNNILIRVRQRFSCKGVCINTCSADE